MAHGQWTEIVARGALEAWKRAACPRGVRPVARDRPAAAALVKKKLRFGVAAVKESALVPVRSSSRAPTRAAVSRSPCCSAAATC